MQNDPRLVSEATSRRETVTVVIPTFNVEKIIARCLDQLKWADAVYVIDMFSTDSTVEVCRGYPNVTVVQRRAYIYANVNFGMEQATTDWVIRLDSDEILDEQLQASIIRVLRNPDPAISGYIFPSVQYMFAKPMSHGVGRRDLVMRKCMFRRGTARYECNSEHEDVVATCTFGVLEGHYHHHTNDCTNEFVRKVLYYTDRDVERIAPESLPPPRTWHTLYRGFRMFILYYVQWKGYKDGYLGFFSSLFRGPVYMFIEEAKRWEAWESRRNQPGAPRSVESTQSGRRLP